MATTNHGVPQHIELNSSSLQGEELWDHAIKIPLEAGDIEAARAEFERQCIASVNSGDPIGMTPEKWEEFRLELHREAKLAS